MQPTDRGCCRPALLGPRWMKIGATWRRWIEERHVGTYPSYTTLLDAVHRTAEGKNDVRIWEVLGGLDCESENSAVEEETRWWSGALQPRLTAQKTDQSGRILDC